MPVPLFFPKNRFALAFASFTLTVSGLIFLVLLVHFHSPKIYYYEVPISPEEYDRQNLPQPLPPPFSPDDLSQFKKPTKEQLEQFTAWAQERSIDVIGISKDSNEAYFEGINLANDQVAVEEVDFWWEAEKALKKIPDSVLRVLAEKAVYLSTKPGRGYTASQPFQDVLKIPKGGIIIEQDINERQVIHELGHMVDFVGILNPWEQRGAGYDIFKGVKEERERIFKANLSEYDPNLANPPAGFVSVYSTANDLENFAEHFVYYVLDAELFREMMKDDLLLTEKHDFFKKWIFAGNEF